MGEIENIIVLDRPSGVTSEIPTPEQLQKNHKVAFVSATHFPGYAADMTQHQEDKTISDNERGIAALENLEELLKQGFRMIIVNNSTQDEFYQKLLLLLQQHHPLLELKIEDEKGKYSGLTGAKRRGLEFAAQSKGVKIIVEFELEKKLSQEDMDNCLRLLREGKAKLVIPNRGDLEGYPLTQRALEQRTNQELNDAAKKAGFLRDPELPNQNQNVPEELDWCGGFRFFVNDEDTVRLFKTQYALQGELATRKVLNEQGVEESINPKKWYDTLYGPVVEMLYKWKVYRRSPLRLLGKEPVVMSVPIHYEHHQSSVEEGSDFFNKKRERQFGQIVEIVKRHINQLNIQDNVRRIMPLVSVLAAITIFSAGGIPPEIPVPPEPEVVAIG